MIFCVDIFREPEKEIGFLVGKERLCLLIFFVKIIETEENELIIEMDAPQSTTENTVYESALPLNVVIQPIIDEKTVNDRTNVLVEEESFNNNRENPEVELLPSLEIEPTLENIIPAKNALSVHHENIYEILKVHESKVPNNPPIKREKDPNKFQCPWQNCGSQFTRKDSVALHIRLKHNCF